VLKSLPSPLEKELFEHCKLSLSTGIQARRVGITWLTFLSFLILLAIVLTMGFGATFLITLTILVSTHFVVWAIYSVSASVNMQFDILTRLVVHYSESNKNNS
jgi:hypothetical protein